ncbi:MAG: O-antigen ligase family protein [Verrucomicrobiota bacterium]
MPTLDWIKLAFILPVFFGIGPLIGMAVKGKPKAQRWLFGIMCFMTINGLLDAGNWGLTLDSVEKYRGHAKGYHFYFNHILAVALMTARWLEDRKSFRWVPPGMLIYGLFIVTASLSIINAPRVDYALMAVHKMSFFALMGLAAFNCLRTVDDIRFFMVVMGGTMVWEGMVVLKLKYLQGQYQVHGTFEHQNSLSMYTILIAMPLLAVALGPKFRGQKLCVWGFLMSAVIIQGALSRASLLMFAAGVAGVSVLSLVEKPTVRRFTVLAVMSAVAALGLSFTLDTIISRFHDQGNDASAELREVLNEAARQMEAAHPLGIGWNNYAHVINAPFPYAEVVYDWIRGRNMKVVEDLPNAPVESHYYLLFSENGYPGLIAWYLVMAAGIFRNLRGFLSFRHSFERCLCLGILTGTSLNYIQSTLERTLTQPRNLMLWLLLYGITGRLDVLRRNRRKGEPVEPVTPGEAGVSPSSAPLPAGKPSSLPSPPSAAPEPVPGPEKRWPSPAGWRAARALSAGSGAASGAAAASALPLPPFRNQSPAGGGQDSSNRSGH